MNLRIRQMRPSDVVAVVRIANQAFLETARLGWLMGRRAVHRLMEDRECLFVAEAGGEVVGFVVGGCSGDRATIGWIAVHPDYWGRGIGGMLLGAVEEVARRKGIGVVETGTPFARSFYEKHGFRCVGVDRCMVLELVGRAISLPEGVRVRTLMLDDIGSLIELMGEEEWLRFSRAFFSAYEDDPEKAIMVTSKEGTTLGVAVGENDRTYGELVTLTYMFVGREGDAMKVLDSMAYLASSRGHRWFGVRLPLEGTSQEELEGRGWEDAKLPSFWTRYRMRKEI